MTNEKGATYTTEILLKRIENLGFSMAKKADLGENVYLLNDEILIDIQSTPLSISRRDFTFKLDEARFDYFYQHHRHFFLLLICESDKRVFVLPLALIMEIFIQSVIRSNNSNPLLNSEMACGFCVFLDNMTLRII
jgi:hypothetical protein